MARQKKQMRNFIEFVNERHKIYERRQRGDPYPWTDDPILCKYKFCNVFRHLDRGSQDFLKFAAPGSMNPLNGLFRAALWTVFNKSETWHRFMAAVNLDGWSKPSDVKEKIVHILHAEVDKMRTEGVDMFTRVYHSTPGGWLYYGNTMSKAAINLVVALISNADITDKFINARNLIDASLALTEIYGIGTFFAWQITINAWWTKAFQFRDDSRALIGYGSLAGLRLLDDVDNDKQRAFAQVLYTCKRHGPQQPMMGAVDVEHALCEWSKYINLQNRRPDKKINAKIYKPPQKEGKTR